MHFEPNSHYRPSGNREFCLAPTVWSVIVDQVLLNFVDKKAGFARTVAAGPFDVDKDIANGAR